MTEVKHCWQIDFLPNSTWCFQKAGGVPCETPGCPVEEAIAESLLKNIPVTRELVTTLCHSHCRISSVSQDNSEFLARMAAQGEKNLLSILE